LNELRPNAKGCNAMIRMLWSLFVLMILILGLSALTAGQEPKQETPKQIPRTPSAHPAEQQPSSGTRYVVQLSETYATAKEADKITWHLRRQYPSAHTQSRSGSDTRYRVRVGPFENREDAEQVATDLQSQGYKGVMILPLKKPPQKRIGESGESQSQKKAAESSASSEQAQESDDGMRRVVTDLSTQVGLLAEELRAMRRETERNSAMLELLLNEDRLSKLEDKLQQANDGKAQLDAREQEIQRRMRNIQGELVLRGGLRRDEAEAAIRADLQRSLDDVHAQQAVYQQRVAELNDQVTRLRARVETLRKKLEPEAKSEK
jgi:SPOR domain